MRQQQKKEKKKRKKKKTEVGQENRRVGTFKKARGSDEEDSWG
jgi:hypothetical protein